MNMMPGNINPMQVGQPGHPMQQPHVMHAGMPMQPGLGGHPMHMSGMTGMGGVMGQPAPGMMMAGPMGGGHMVGMQQMQPVPHQQQIQQQQFAQQQQQPALEQIDPISKVKLMLPQLKDSLNKIFSDSAFLLNNTVQEGAERQTDPANSNRIEKSLEKFHNICDMMELNLKLSMEVYVHNMESRKYVPCNVTEMSTAPQTPDVLTYPQYVTVVKSQIAFAKEIKDMINNCAKKVNKHLSLTPSE